MGPYNQRYAAEYIWMWGAISVSAITYALASFMPKGVCISQGDAHMQRQNRRLTIILYVDSHSTQSTGGFTFCLHQLSRSILYHYRTSQLLPLAQ